MKLRWDHWHIELSSVCALRCPRCPRSEVTDTLLNRQLTLEFFQKQLTEPVLTQVKKITFCGNDGDPIYCRDLIKICQWLKDINPALQIVIVTNGSHKTNDWWHQLGHVLDHQDEINWSIDGWDQASNEQYRVNSDWHSIVEGIKTFGSTNQHTFRVWAAIAFRFNQQKLDHMQTLAGSLGMDAWQLTKSTKFGSHYPEVYGTNDPLCPDDGDLVSSSHRFERDVVSLTSKSRPGADLKNVFWARAQTLLNQGQHSGICLIGNKGVFLNSRGEFYPCCWTATRYAHNSEWHALAGSRFNLWHRNFQQILEDDFWQKKFLAFDSLECQTKCTAARLKDRTHVTEW